MDYGNDIDRRYVSRKEGGRGVTNIEDCIDVSTLELEEYIKKSKEKLITAVNNGSGNIRTKRKTTKTRK